MLNIRSLLPKIDELKPVTVGFDIICICETWLTDGISNQLINIPGYELFRLDRNSQTQNANPGKSQRGGGVCLYVRDKYIKHTEAIQESSSISDNVEQLWISIKCPDTKNKVIGVIYRPPSGNIKSCINEIRISMEKVYNCTSEFIICGDFDINHNLRHTESFQLLKDFERYYILNQIIKDNTRITCKSSTRIDLILTNCSSISDSGTIESSISDHEIVFFVKKKNRLKAERTSILARTFQNYVKKDFQDDVKHDPRWDAFW